MTIRRLLFLDAAGLTAWRWQSDGPREEAAFLPDPGGFAAFDEYLVGRRGSLYHLLADVTEEGFQVEDVPWVQGSDHREMIRRKLAQYFYGTPLSLAISLGRGREGRRDEKVLFAGLTAYSHFEPWLRILRDAEAELAGIYSMPLVLAGMISRLAGDSAPVLLMSVSRAGLRQTFFDHGQLRFSRLTPMATGMIGEVATACATETRKIYQYLAGQRLITRDAPLKTLVLANPGHFDIIADRCRDTPERQVLLVDLAAEAKKQGLATAPEDSRGDALFLHMLAKRPPRNQFAPPAERRAYRLWQTRFAINAVATAILALCLLFTGSQMTVHAELTERTMALRTEVDLGNRRYDHMLKGLPAADIGHERLRALTERHEALSRLSAGPEPLLRHISRSLTDAGKIELGRIEWRVSPSPDASPVDAKKNSGRAGEAYAVATIEAQLPLSMANDHRSQLETVDAFVASLAGPDIQARLISLPFDAESGKSIKSGEAGNQVLPPKFVLRVAAKL